MFRIIFFIGCLSLVVLSNKGHGQSINYNFEAHIANYKKCIKKEYLIVQKGIGCKFLGNYNYDYHAPCRVSSYSLIILRGDTIKYVTQEHSPFFCEKTKEEFDKLQVGDIILIYDIFIQTAENNEKVLSVLYDIR